MDSFQRNCKKHFMRPIAESLVILFTILTAAADVNAPTQPKHGADLLKTDIMGVLANPDDETGDHSRRAWAPSSRGRARDGDFHRGRGPEPLSVADFERRARSMATAPSLLRGWQYKSNLRDDQGK